MRSSFSAPIGYRSWGGHVRSTAGAIHGERAAQARRACAAQAPWFAWVIEDAHDDGALGDERDDLHGATALPLFAWSLIARGWAIPVREGLGRAGLWPALAAVGVFGWAQRRSRAIAWLLVVLMATMLAATHGLHGLLGTERLTMLAAIALATASLALLASRRIEGLALAPRALLDDVATGALALCAAVLRRSGISCWVHKAEANATHRVAGELRPARRSGTLSSLPRVAT